VAVVLFPALANPEPSGFVLIFGRSLNPRHLSPGKARTVLGDAAVSAQSAAQAN
jgi:hypothetical protein